MSLVVPEGLRPRDGRFGSGPTKVRPAQLDALVATGRSYLGTSHRQEPVRSVVRRIRQGVASLFDAPDGYEVVLGDGGATAFWDVATCCLIEHRSQHLVLGEFSRKFASAAAAAPFLDEPSVVSAPPGSAPVATPAEGIDAYCWPHNETSTGVVLPVARPSGTDASSLVLVDATSAAGGVPVDCSAVDAYYFAPQKVFGSDGGLWLALLSPAAADRVLRLVGSRWVPASLNLGIAIDNSRKDQTYNTPALTTLFLMAEQLDWLASRGGLAWSCARTAESSGRVYDWAEKSSYASPFVTNRSLRSPVVCTVRFDDSLDATSVTKVLRDSGIVDVEAYRAAGYNGLRIGTFPAVEPDDVSALLASVDWVVDHL